MEFLSWIRDQRKKSGETREWLKNGVTRKVAYMEHFQHMIVIAYMLARQIYEGWPSLVRLSSVGVYTIVKTERSHAGPSQHVI